MTAETLSNWGRWGPNDERGTLNLMTPALVKQAAGLVKSGQVYSLGMPLAAEGPQWPTRHKTWKVTKYSNNPTGRSGADDIVTMHSHSGTHIDALCHVWYDDQIYNGYNATEHITSDGATRNAIDKAPFIVGRGILLDVAAWKQVDHLALGEGISATDLVQCAQSQSVEIRAGDVMLVRTGWIQLAETDRELFDSGEPGLDLSTLFLLKERDIIAIGADNHAVEVIAQMPPDDLPFHPLAIRDVGLYLMEYLNLEALAGDQIYEFLFMVTPLPLTGAVGSPINPIAIA